MKQEFSSRPESFIEEWPGEFDGFSWHDYLTAIPSPLFVVTSYKENGRENASLQSWSAFVGDKGEFICLIGNVHKNGHLYQSIQQRKCCVLNFPTRDIYGKCYETISHNEYETDEITRSGLTAEKAVTVDAPRIRECFLNIECELLWEHEHFEGSYNTVLALRATHICMDTDFCDEMKKGRYGKDGFLYNIHAPRNADTGEVYPTCVGGIMKY